MHTQVENELQVDAGVFVCSQQGARGVEKVKTSTALKSTAKWGAVDLLTVFVGLDSGVNLEPQGMLGV